MVNDAEKFKDEDNKLKNRISAKNGMENNCFNIKTTTEKNDKNNSTGEQEENGDETPFTFGLLVGGSGTDAKQSNHCD